MEFDKTKVFTAFNVDEVKVGSKGYFADFKENLISRVQLEDKEYYSSIIRIDDVNEYPFKDSGAWYRYFYLVEEPVEKVQRPCTREELLEMLKKQGLPMLKSSSGNFYYTIRSISDNNVFINENRSYKSLRELYTLIDGTPLWVEE